MQIADRVGIDHDPVPDGRIFDIGYSMIHVISKYRLEAEWMQILQGWMEAGKLPQVLVVSFGPVANNVQDFLSSQSHPHS